MKRLRIIGVVMVLALGLVIGGVPQDAAASATNETITYGNTAQIGGTPTIQQTMAGTTVTTNNLPFTVAGSLVSVQLSIESSTAVTDQTNVVSATIQHTVDGTNYGTGWTIGPLTSLSNRTATVISNFSNVAVPAGRVQYITGAGTTASNMVIRLSISDKGP